MKKQKFNSYRATFNHALKCNYWDKRGVEGISFREVHTKNWPLLQPLYMKAKELDIQYHLAFLRALCGIDMDDYSIQEQAI